MPKGVYKRTGELLRHMRECNPNRITRRMLFERNKELTQVEFAKKIGLSRQRVSQLCKTFNIKLGRISPNIFRYKKKKILLLLCAHYIDIIPHL